MLSVDLIENLLEDPHLFVPSGIIVVLFLAFFIFFLLPAILLGRKLGKIHTRLKSTEFRDVCNPEQLTILFERDAKLAHLWSEYRKTLYDALPESGGIVPLRWRSTVAAETFWNGALVVDGRVHAEFFKHTPGLFTGIGIIGTFIGLIEGLGKFNVSSDASAVSESLKSLMHSVSSAFMVSAGAIIVAMLVTFVEKFLLNLLFTKVDRIAQLLDERFEAAAAEQFLEKTASASEEAATQLKQLKGELLKDLTPILHELSDKQSQMLERLAGSFKAQMQETAQIQIEAARNNTTAMAETISGAISNGLSGPLDEIKTAVKQAAGDQSSNAISMLQDVMASFSQKLNDLFGGQISGINELNQRTAQTMQDAVSKLDDLVASLQDAGRNSSASMAEHMAKALTDMEARQSAITQSTQQLVAELKQTIAQSQATTSAGLQSSSDEMARRMAEAMEKMEQRQNSINEHTQAFVEQIKTLVSSSQTETGNKVQSTLQAIGDQMATMLQQFQTTQHAALESGRQREEHTASRTQDVVNTLVTSIDTLLQQTTQVSVGMQESVTALTTMTTSAISRLSDGAGEVNAATRNFAAASDKAAATINQVAGVATQLSDVSASMTVAASALQQGVQDYREHREAVTHLVSELKGLVANAKSDVSITSSVLQRIEQATGKLSAAQLETEKFMLGVATVLAKAHEEFRASVTNSLKVSNHDFQDKLSQAVGMLGGSIRELEGLLSSVTPTGVAA